jgi:DNA polymerase III subunit beta
VNLTITREELTAIADRAKGIVEASKTSPILGCVVITAALSGVITATSYRAAMGYVGTYSANVSERGTIAVDADALSLAIKSLPSGPISVALNPSNLRLTLSVGKSKTTISTVDPADHPGVVVVDGKHTLTVEAPALHTIMKQTAKCIADDDNRYGLSCLLLEYVGGKLRAVSTDGNRLAWSECAATGDIPSGIQVPRECAAEIGRMAEGISGTIEIDVEPGPRTGSKPRAIAVRLPGETLTIRCAEVDFPAYRDVLPKSFKREWTVNRVDLCALLRRFPFKGELRTVTMTLTNDTAHFLRKWDTGEATAEIDATYAGERVVMGLNGVYLANALDLCTGDVVAVKMGDVLSPVIIEDPTNSAAQFVVMPVRLD